MEQPVQSSHPHAWVKGRDHRFLRVNPEFGAALDHPPASMIGRRDSDFFPPDVVVRYRQDDRVAVESGRCVLFFEHPVHTPAPGWITSKRALRRAGGLAIVGVARPWSTDGIHQALRIPPATEGASVGGSNWLPRLERCVRARFRERLVIGELAGDVGRNPDYVGRRFQEVVGLSLHGLVRKLRVAWSLERLSQGEADLSVLALRAGFSDQSHFTRTFKREVGLPPGAFRKAFA